MPLASGISSSARTTTRNIEKRPRRSSQSCQGRFIAYPAFPHGSAARTCGRAPVVERIARYFRQTSSNVTWLTLSNHRFPSARPQFARLRAGKVLAFLGGFDSSQLITRLGARSRPGTKPAAATYGRSGKGNEEKDTSRREVIDGGHPCASRVPCLLSRSR